MTNYVYTFRHVYPVYNLKMFLFSCCPFFSYHIILALIALSLNFSLTSDLNKILKVFIRIYKTILQKYNKTIKYFIVFSNTWITHRVEDLPATVKMKNSNKMALPLISTYVPVFHLILSRVHLPHIPYFSINSFIQQWSLHKLKIDLKVKLIQTVSFHPI